MVVVWNTHTHTHTHPVSSISNIKNIGKSLYRADKIHIIGIRSPTFWRDLTSYSYSSRFLSRFFLLPNEIHINHIVSLTVGGFAVVVVLTFVVAFMPIDDDLKMTVGFALNMFGPRTGKCGFILPTFIQFSVDVTYYIVGS